MSTGRKIAIALGVVLLLFVFWETLTSLVAYADNAYVRSDLVGLAPQVTGHVVGVHVQDNRPVRRGDLLLSIDPVPFQLAVNAAKTALAESVAQAEADRATATAAKDAPAGAVAARDLAHQNGERTRKLTAESFASRAALDAANQAMRHAETAVDAAQAAVARATRNIAAPVVVDVHELLFAAVMVIGPPKAARTAAAG
jgi:multidrug efflux system membrane fusion protein